MSWEDIVKKDRYTNVIKEEGFSEMFDKYGNKEVKILMRLEEFKKIVEDAYPNANKYSMKLRGKPVDGELASMIMWLSMNKPSEAYKKLKSQGFELLMTGDLE